MFEQIGTFFRGRMLPSDSAEGVESSHEVLLASCALLLELAYADEHLGRLVEGLTSDRRWLIIMCADHGDAFGEDGYHGRGIAHPTVLAVPFAAWLSA